MPTEWMKATQKDLRPRATQHIQEMIGGVDVEIGGVDDDGYTAAGSPLAGAEAGRPPRANTFLCRGIAIPSKRIKGVSKINNVKGTADEVASGRELIDRILSLRLRRLRYGVSRKNLKLLSVRRLAATSKPETKVKVQTPRWLKTWMATETKRTPWRKRDSPDKVSSAEAADLIASSDENDMLPPSPTGWDKPQPALTWQWTV